MPLFIARLFLQQAAQQRKSATLLFGDLRKCYYSVLVELVTSPMFTQEARQTILQNLNTDELRKQVIWCDLTTGHCLFDDIPLLKELFQKSSENGNALPGLR